jgi:hypothetical protein
MRCRAATCEPKRLQRRFDLSRLSTVLTSLATQPGYTLMRGVARFSSVRSLVAGIHGMLQGTRQRQFLAQCELHLSESWFPDLDRATFLRQLHEEGIAYGLKLPPAAVAEIRSWAEQQVCYADREPNLGLRVADRGAAEAKLGKPILLAQYFNTATECPAIARLVADPVLQWVAARYLCSVPTFVGANMWWTFPVQALEADRSKHAHVYHRDVDDFRFFKFFFYLTDVPAGEGAHVCVVATHREPPHLKLGDRWNIRRYADEEIAAAYSPQRVHEICGEAGTGFAENTLCIHKGSTPRHEARLLLQLQFALFDYGAMHDRRAPQTLARLV